VTHRVEHLNPCATHVGIGINHRHQDEIVAPARREHRAGVAPQVDKLWTLQARPARRATQSLNQARRKGGNGTPIDSLHQPFRHN